MKQILFLSLGLVACGQWQPPSPPAPRSGIVVETSFAKTWDAVIDIFSEKNIAIKTMDRTSGLIVAETANVEDNHYKQPEIKLWNDCGGWDANLRLYANTVTYNILVRGDSVRSTVKANFLWSKKKVSQYDFEAVCISKGVQEDAWEKRIAEIARSK
jgi:hypothetical protein